MTDLFDLPFEDDDQPSGPREAGAPRAADPRRAAGPEPAQARTPPDAGRGADVQPVSPGRRVLSVSQLTVAVRDLLESELFEVWVEGELSNCRQWNTGHVYFTLKDARAQLHAVIFRSALRYLKFKPTDGLKVIARGRISVYEPKGEYQLVCEHLEPHGLGRLQLAFDQLRARLQEEGLFDASRKRPLPSLPRRIGLVTSLDGAAVRDMLKVLGRRHASVHVVIRPVRVQGEGAAVDIARGLRIMGRSAGVDVIIVGRGGGSVEDLWAFNEEIVARAIALSPVPVISAVGHETDVTIADFVADVRAPTPSAAAEIVIAAKDDVAARIGRADDRLRAAVHGRVQWLGRRLDALTGRPAFAGYRGRLANRERQVAELEHGLTRLAHERLRRCDRQLQQLWRRLDTCDLGRRLATIRTRLVAADGRLRGAVDRRVHLANVRLRASAGRLDTLSPLAVLGRGYAVCWNAERSAVVRDAAEASPGDRVRVTLARGELDCEVRTADPARGEHGRDDLQLH
jgi:exodeoxyribonuclease VII large subunit